MSSPSMIPASPPSVARYDYDQASVLTQRSRYAQAPYGGEAFLEAYATSRVRTRHDLAQRLRGVAPSPAEAWLVAWLESVREPGHVPRALAPEEPSSDVLAVRAILGSATIIDTVEAVHGVLLPYLRCAARLDAASEPWGVELLRRLLGRYEAFGKVYANYDANWQALGTEANTPAILVSLAAAAGWVAWGERRSQPAGALASLNVLLKVCDHLSAGLAHAPWSLGVVDLHLCAGAFELEQRLVAQLAVDRGVALRAES